MPDVFTYNKTLQRNEILAEGELINAYHTSHWTGKLLGNIKLLRRVNKYGNQEDWHVEYITGDGNTTYHTSTPETIPNIEG